MAQYLWSSTAQVNAELPDHVCFVIDGGSLLHRVPWPHGSSYNELIQMYIDFVIRVYKKGTVVFDGYSQGPSTKDSAHLRRSHGGNASTYISFGKDMLLYDTKERFLRNPSNKQRFISMLDNALQSHGFKTRQALADADCMIVGTVLQEAQEGDVALVGEDTDLLVLLLAHIKPEHHQVYFKPSSTKSEARIWEPLGLSFVTISCSCMLLEAVIQLAVSLASERVFPLKR